MKTKHTPAPWKVDYRYSNDKRVICSWYPIKDENGYIIAETEGDYGGIKNSTAKANAALIAAAPELLEALHNLVNAASGDTIENLKIAIADAKATIKKATS